MKSKPRSEVAALVARIEARIRKGGERPTRIRVALACGVGYSTLYRWLWGEASPSPMALANLRRAAGLQTDQAF